MFSQQNTTWGHPNCEEAFQHEEITLFLIDQFILILNLLISHPFQKKKADRKNSQLIIISV
jgi:hypothetical protein